MELRNEEVKNAISAYEKRVLSLENRIQIKDAELITLSLAFKNLKNIAEQLLALPFPKKPLTVEISYKPLPLNYLNYRLNEKCFGEVLNFLHANELAEIRAVSRQFNKRTTNYVKVLTQSVEYEAEKLINNLNNHIAELGMKCVQLVDFTSLSNENPSKITLFVLYSLLIIWNIDPSPKWENVLKLFENKDRLNKMLSSFKVLELNTLNSKRAKSYIAELKGEEELGSNRNLQILWEYVHALVQSEEELRLKGFGKTFLDALRRKQSLALLNEAIFGEKMRREK